MVTEMESLVKMTPVFKLVQCRPNKRMQRTAKPLRALSAADARRYVARKIVKIAWS